MDGFQGLYNKKEHSDFSIISDDGELRIYLNRLILSLKSEYFYNEFNEIQSRDYYIIVCKNQILIYEIIMKYFYGFGLDYSLIDKVQLSDLIELSGKYFMFNDKTYLNEMIIYIFTRMDLVDTNDVEQIIRYMGIQDFIKILMESINFEKIENLTLAQHLIFENCFNFEQLLLSGIVLVEKYKFNDTLNKINFNSIKEYILLNNSCVKEKFRKMMFPFVNVIMNSNNKILQIYPLVVHIFFGKYVI